MPVVHVEVNGFLALTVQVVPVTVGDDGIDTQCCLICQTKAKRSNIYGYGDTEIIGIDGWQNVLLLCIADSFGAGRE